MTAACNAPLIHRLKRRSREDADPALAALVAEVEVSAADLAIETFVPMDRRSADRLARRADQRG